MGKVTVINYYRNFSYPGRMQTGYSFPCDENGNVFESKLNKHELKRYFACMEGKNGITDNGVSVEKYAYTTKD